MSTDVSLDRLIESTPDVRKGRPCIAGTGVTVRRVVQWYRLGHAPEDIADRIGHLSLAQIYGALAYYHANQDAIEADLEEEATTAETLEREHAGIVLGTQQRYSVGERMRKLLRLRAERTAEDMQNRVVFLASVGN